jgi:hypothetical protein
LWRATTGLDSVVDELEAYGAVEVSAREGGLHVHGVVVVDQGQDAVLLPASVLEDLLEVSVA